MESESCDNVQPDFEEEKDLIFSLKFTEKPSEKIGPESTKFPEEVGMVCATVLFSLVIEIFKSSR